jgi:quercetin dioxygenase-like cupin family protein
MKRLIVVLIAAAPALLMSQDSRIPLENDHVRVVKVTQDPHKKTRLHDHKVNRVMIYLTAGKQTIDYQDGKHIDNTWKAGEPKWSPASGMHIAEIVSDKPVTIVEVELKHAGTGKKAGASALDPVKVDPKHYKVEMENDQVRVLRVKIGPKEVVPMHEHTLNRVVTYLTDQDFSVMGADGKIEHPTHKAGEVSWGGMAKHKEENLSDKPFEVVVVELK